MEESRLEEHVGGPRPHHRRLPAHHAAERHRPAGVGDREQSRAVLHLLLVEQSDALAGLHVAHVDRAFELGVVERVHRLAAFEHHVVGDVHQRMDRAQPRALEASHHPGRRGRARIESANDPAVVGAASLRLRDADGTLVLDRSRDRGGRAQLARGTDDRRGVARDAEHRQAVAAIGRELESEVRVVEREDIANVAADGRIVGKHQQPRVVVREAELARRAQHAARLDPAQLRLADLERRRGARRGRKARAYKGARHLLPRGDIRRAAYDLQRLARPRVHLGDAQLVGIRMRGDALDQRDDHALERARDRRHLLHLEAAHRERVREALDRHVDAHQLLEPLQRDLHAAQPGVIGIAPRSAGRSRRTAAGRSPRT